MSFSNNFNEFQTLRFHFSSKRIPDYLIFCHFGYSFSSMGVITQISNSLEPEIGRDYS
jgi:hypothetical protein